MPDPFAHGTPAGDGHVWVDPGAAPCSDCECCTERLCRTATQAGQVCAAASPEPDLVASCRCTTPTTGATDE